jgi:hypothetical protein
VRIVVGFALVAALVGGCASDDDGPSGHGGPVGHDHHGASIIGVVAGRPDAVIAGPQGRVGQFVVECAFSHAAADDPVVMPGRPGESHLHVFFGNSTVDANSTVDSLRGAPTTCDQQLDHAAYWTPALLLDGELVEPTTSTAYYRAGIGVDPTVVEPFPEGLVMIAGRHDAAEPQPLEIVAWTCGTGIERSALPPECPAERGLRMLVTFPDCWDGVQLDAPDHAAHVAYSTGGACPDSHSVHVPQLQFAVQYPHAGSTDGLSLASGSLLTGHADFVNLWDPEKLAIEVSSCLRRSLVCGVTSSRAGE